MFLVLISVTPISTTPFAVDSLTLLFVVGA
jgi:hypothetical protein